MSFKPMTNPNHFDSIIFYQGAAAFSAVLYTGRYKMSTLILGEEFGSETATSNIIENYPGQFQIDGLGLMLNMRQQVEALEVNIIDGQVDRIVRESDRITVKANDQSY